MPLIRPASAADIPAITAIYRHYVLHSTTTFELEAPRESEMLMRFYRITDAQLPFLVASADDAILGYIYAAPYRARPAYRHTVEDTIYLHHEQTGLGYGTALLGDLIQRCTALGYRQMIAIVGGNDPQSPSLKLHRRLGFRDAGLLQGIGRKFDQWLDTALLQRALHPNV